MDFPTNIRPNIDNTGGLFTYVDFITFKLTILFLLIRKLHSPITQGFHSPWKYEEEKTRIIFLYLSVFQISNNFEVCIKQIIIIKYLVH